MANQEGGKAILHLYRRLLRSSEKYPSKKRWDIYKAIQEEFRENVDINPNDAQKKISVAYKGLQQLGMYKESALGGADSPNWVVELEKNPMPRPNH